MNQTVSDSRSENPYSAQVVNGDKLAPKSRGRDLAIALALPLVTAPAYQALSEFVLKRLPFPNRLTAFQDPRPKQLPITLSEFDLFAWFAVFLVAVFFIVRGRRRLAAARWRRSLLVVGLIVIAAVECLCIGVLFHNSRI